MAYDFKGLMEELKKLGLNVAEDAAKEVVPVVLNWLEMEMVKSPNKYDDILLVAFPVIKKQLLDWADMIDGQAG